MLGAARMAEYDLDGWKVPDLTNPGELSHHIPRSAPPANPAGLRPVGGGGGGKGGGGRSYPGGFRNPFAT